MSEAEDIAAEIQQRANERRKSSTSTPLDGDKPPMDIVINPPRTLDTGFTPVPPRKPLTAIDLQKDRLSQAIDRASTANPADAAQRKDVAKTLGIHPSLVGNVQEAKAEAFVKKQSNMDRLINENPELARYMLANDHNPELVGQDVEPLAKLAKLGRRLGVDPLISLVGKGSSMVTQGVVGLADLGGALIPGKDIGQHLQEAGFDFKGLDKLLEESYSPEQQLANQNVAKAEGFVGTMGAIAENPSAAAHWVLSSLSLLAGGGAISQTLLKVAPHVGARIAAGVGEGALVAGTLQEQIRQKTATGTTTPIQKALAVAGGVGTGIIGGIGASIAKKAGIPDIDSYIAQGGLKGALEAAKTPSSLIKAVVGGVVIEGAAEEMPQSVWEKFIENVATGMPWDHELGKEAAIGLVAGSMTQAGFTPMMVRGANQQIADNVDKDKKKAAFEVLKKTSEGFKAEERRKQFEELGKAAAETPLRNTSAESFGEFVDQMTEDSDITDVFVDEKKLTEIFAQSGLTEKEIAEKMPALAAELKIARGAKTDVKIPMKDYLTHIAGTPAEKALLDHLKIDPEGMSFAESQAFFQGQKADLDLKAQEIVAQNTPVLTAEEYAADPEAGKTYEQYLAEHTNTREVLKADSDAVYQKLLSGLEKAGRFSPAANAVYAIPFREFFVTAAARESKASGRLVLPSEVYAREPLNFARQNLAGFTQTPAEGVPAVATTEDFSPENISNILDKEGWVLMTAANPENTTQSAEQNDAANKALIADLESRGLKHEVVQGRYGNDETETPSVLILGTDRATQLELVRKYRQESILTKEGLVFQDGSILPPQGGVTTFKDTKKAFASGGYTRIPSTGTIFSLSFEGSVPRQPGSAFYRPSQAQPGSMTLVGIHYSKEARTVLEGKRFGEGYPGAERDRLIHGAKAGDPIRTRVDFYADIGNGVKPESGLGGVKHEVLLTNIYDGSTNPKGFSAPATWDGMNVFEQQVLAAGYDGYYVEQSGQGRVVLLGQAAEQIPVPTKEQLDEQRRERILQSETGAEPPAREADGSLKGLPRQVGGFNAAHYARAEEVTRDYMAAAGLPYNPPTTYATVDPVRATRIADAFEAMKHDPQDPEVKAAYAALIKETTAQYQAVIDSGLVVEFIDFEKTGDPYAGNPRAMTEDVINNNHMWVFSTREGFGSSEFDPADNPLLTETEFSISGQKALANDLFRVVHDYFGHVKEGVGFRATGEENAWRAHMSMFSPLAGRALTVETRGQNSWVNYGPYAESNRTASAGDTHYADQKIGLLPEWVSTEGATDTTAIDHYFQFAGEASLSADVNSLETAKRMLAQGTHQESVRRSTGWFKGADGRWRYEINDYDATLLNDDYPSKNFGDFWTGIEKEKIDSGMLSADDIKDGAGVKLSDVLDHPALFTAYPGLRDIIVKPQLERGGSYNRGTNVISIGYDIEDGARSNPATIFSILMHEVQHAIQTLEGFARGGNLAIAEYVSSEQLTKALDENRAKSDAVGLEDPYGLENRMASGYAVSHKEKVKYKKWQELQFERGRIFEKKMKPLDAYLRLYGEMEARNVQSRLNLDEFGRRVTPIQETYNEGLTDEDAVVILNDELIKLPPLSAMIVSTRTPTPQAGRGDPHLSSGLNVDIEALYRAPSMINAIVNGTPTIKGITSYKGFKLPRSKDPKKVIESFIQQMTGNLLWLHDQVPAEVRERSKQWYDGGRVLVDRMVDRHKGLYTPQQAAAAYALMSPKMPWDRNVSLSDRIVDIWTDHQDTDWSPEMDKVLKKLIAPVEDANGVLKPPGIAAVADQVKGKRLSELPNNATLRALWIRAYDEAHNPRGYRALTPEGGFGDFVTKLGGGKMTAAWSTYNVIADVLSVLQDGSMPNISRQLGQAHKVRNFYNNLLMPSDSSAVTIDTHAVAAGHLRPLGASSIEVNNSLGKLGSSPAEGLSGTYVLYAEAYRRAAAARGLKPREMQSITWEAGRGLFNPSFKTNYAKSKELRDKFDAISTDLAKGVIDHAEARQRILDLSGGVQDPSWTKFDAGFNAESPGSSYTGELLGLGGVQGAVDSRRRSESPARVPVGRYEQSIFYSALEREIGGLRKIASKEGWVDTEQAKAWISARQKEGKFKKEEVEAIGVLDWLEGLGAKVPIYDILDFVADNGIRVTETVLTEGGMNEEDTLQAIREDAEVIEYAGEDEEESEPVRWRVRHEGVSYETNENPEEMSDKDLADLVRYDPDVGMPTQYGRYTVIKGENYKELLLTLPNRGKRDVSYASPHFDDIENILAHTRISEVKIRAIPTPDQLAEEAVYRAEVKRLEDIARPLMVEKKALSAEYEKLVTDVREKLTGEARAKFKKELAAQTMSLRAVDDTAVDRLLAWMANPPKEVKELTTRMEEVSARVRELSNEVPGKPDWLIYGTPQQRVLFVEEIQSDWAQEGRKKGFATAEGIEAAPFVENTKSWTALAVKRVLRYAAENGFDKVAWTTGEQQAERYALNKQISEIQYDPERKLLKARDKDDNKVLEEIVEPEKLDDYVGKELADRLLEVPLNGGYHTLSGVENLEIGGEGMKTFYNKMLPQVVSDVLKKLGGGKIGTVDLTKAGGSVQQAFDLTPELRATVMQGLPLFQGAAQGARASFDPSSLTIALLKGADLSSVIHEGGHFYLEALSRMAAMPEAPQSVRDDFQKTMDWFGVTADVWTVMDMEARRPYHEQWAQSWERYALEGKSPTIEMQPVFAKFRSWMLSVYKSMKEFLKQNPLAGRLNDDVRGVFDRLIASDEAIAEAEKIRGYLPLFTSADQAGLTQEKFQEYLDMGQAATDAATSTLAARSIKDMQWASGARAAAIKKLQNEARSKRKEILAEVTQEVMEEPVNQARLFLTKGETLQDDGTKVKAEAGFKLDKTALQELYPGIDLSSISRMVGADGIAPDLAAQMFAFPSGQALVDALLNEESARDKITGLTDQRMLERYGDLTDDKAIERAADAAIHNRVRAKFMATGLALLRKQPGAAAPINKAARMAAKGALAGKMIRDIKPNQFTAAESRANAEAIKRAATNPAGAVEAQRAALLNNHMARIARNTLDEVEAGLRYVKKFDKLALRKTLGPDYMEQIDDLLSNFDFRKSTPLSRIDKARSLQDWIDEQEANGYEPALDTDLLEVLKRKSYKEMTSEEFTGLIDAIKQIEHIARLKNRLLTAKEAKEFKATIDEAGASIIANANRTVPERETPTDVVGKMGKWFRQMVASHRKFNSVIREMDGFNNAGVMWDILARPMNEAGDKEVEMRQQAAEALGDLFGELKNKDTVPANLYAKKRIVPGTDISMTQEQRIMFGMNWGNEGNRQRLMDGGITGRKALSIEEAEAILDTLTKEEWDFIQGTLDFVGSYREQIAALERQLTGTEPKWIDPAPIETKFGTYKGGYFPAKYDAEMSTRSESLDAVNDMRMGMKGAFGSSATRNGYTKERAKQVIGRPLLLSFNTISQHVSEVTHRLAWQPWLIDANRILKALDAPIREHYGTEILREMRNTVLDIAAGDIGPRNAMEAAINHLRTGSTIVGMGWKVTTALLQPSGLAQSWTRLGSRWASVGVAQYLKNPLAAGRFVDARSSLMRNRGITMQREINEVLNTLRSGDKISAVTGSYFTMIGKMQRTVDIPTWIGAYNRDLAEAGYENALGEEERAKMEEHAVAVADQTVIDTQSGGQIKDLASIQRGSPLQKLFTNFYSYFSATYNLNVEAVRRTSFKSPGEVGLLAIDLILLNIVPVLFGVALKQIMKGDCDWDDVECLLRKVANEQISYMAGQMILLREVSVAAQAIAGDDTYGYQGPAGLRFFSDLYKLGTQTGQREADLGWFKAANSVGGALLHYPAGQINATLDGIMAIEDGRVEGISILPALIAGAPKE